MEKTIEEKEVAATTAVVTPVEAQPETAAAVAEPTPITPPADTREVEVMVINPDDPPEVQAKERMEALRLGLHVVVPNKNHKAAAAATPEKKDDEPVAAEGAPAQEEAEELHPLAKHLLGDPEPQQAVKVPAPVKEFYDKHGLGDASEVVREYPRLKTQVTELQQKLDAANGQLQLISGLDPDLKNVLDTGLSGGDWRNSDALKRQPFDFRIPVDKVDPAKLAQAYVPEIPLTKQDLEEAAAEEGDPAIKAKVAAVFTLGRDRYAVQQNEANSYLTKRQEEYNRHNETFARTRDASIERLKSRVPGIDPYLGKVKDMFTPQGIMNHFFEKDGATVKPDAMEDFLYAVERPALMESYQKRAQRQAKDAATLDVIRRTPEKKVAAQIKTSAEGKKAPTEERGRELVRQAMGR